MTKAEAAKVAELVESLASARIALQGCMHAMRAMAGHGGMPAIIASATLNRISVVLNRVQEEPFIVEVGDANANNE